MSVVAGASAGSVGGRAGGDGGGGRWQDMQESRDELLLKLERWRWGQSCQRQPLFTPSKARRGRKELPPPWDVVKAYVTSNEHSPYSPACIAHAPSTRYPIPTERQGTTMTRILIVPESESWENGDESGGGIPEVADVDADPQEPFLHEKERELHQERECGMELEQERAHAREQAERALQLELQKGYTMFEENHNGSRLEQFQQVEILRSQLSL